MWYVGHPSLSAHREATCARPMGLSGIGIDTLGCTEVESELQIGKEKEKENKANRCEVNAYGIKPQRNGLYFSGSAKDNGPDTRICSYFSSYISSYFFS